MSEEEQKEDDSMEEILSSIRETVEEEVDKADAVTDKTADDLVNELLSEEISEDTPSEEVNDSDLMEASQALASMADAKAELDAQSDEASVDDLMSETVSDDTEVEASAEDLMSESSSDEKAEVEVGAEASAEKDTSNEDVKSEDILELTDIVDESGKEEMIDVDKFAASGEVATADAGSVQASRENYTDNPDDIEVDLDGIMSEMQNDGELPKNADGLPSAADAASFIAENNTEKDDIEDIMGENSDTEEVAASEDIAVAASDKVVNEAVKEIAQKVFLPTSPSAKGLQVSFPAEVLAEALRPLVTGWIEDNLADIVERLVKEELNKLVEK